jgi:hypothetical protein
MRLANANQTDNFTYEFDVLLKSNGTSFELTSYQCVFNFDWTALIQNGGTLTFSYINGTSQITNIPSYGIGINTLDGIRELTFASSPGSDVITTTEKRIGRFRLTNTTQFNGINPDPNWNFAGMVYTIITGAAFANITNQAYHTNTIGSGNQSVTVELKIFLEGGYKNGSIQSNLRDSGYVPLSQPYNSSPWNYTGSENVTSLPAGIADWILIELRTGIDSASIIAKRAAFVKTNGSVVDIDGVSEVTFTNVNPANYYVVIRHRNHLPVMSINSISLTSNSSLYDFTTGQNKAYGTQPLANLGTAYGMYAGDSDLNKMISVLDYSVVANSIFENGYKMSDLDMNGIVNVLDYGKTHKNMLKTSQVP